LSSLFDSSLFDFSHSGLNAPFSQSGVVSFSSFVSASISKSSFGLSFTEEGIV